MTTHALPHDPYITAVDDALTAAGIGCDDGWTSDVDECDADGDLTLSAIFTWQPGNTALAADPYEHGAGVYWSLSSGWQWAERRADGSNEQPQYLPLPLWAEPADVVAAVRAVLTCQEPPTQPAREWQDPAVAAAVEAWAAE